MSKLYSYQGEFDHETMSRLLMEIKDILSTEIDNRILVRNAYGVCVECLENMKRHEDDATTDALKSSELSLEKLDEGLFFMTKNAVSEKARIELQNMYNEFSTVDDDRLKRKRVDKMRTGVLSEKGGAGIGLLNVFINSRSVTFEFEKDDMGIHYYKLTAKLNV